MRRKVISYGGALLLAGAAILATPDSVWAQHHGGGGGAHFGGGHFGGSHFGGGHFGGYHGGYHYGYPGAYSYPRSGYYHSYPRYGYRSYYSYPYYSYPYYSYPYYSYPYYYNTYPNDWSDPGYDSGYYGSYGDVTPSYPDNYSSVIPPAASSESFAPAAAQPDTSAHISVNVPADAEIWFGGTKMTSNGSVREYESPSLTPGSRYSYEVRARWKENGHEVTQTQQVEVSAGAHVNVSFPVAPKTAGQASAVKQG